MIPVGLPCQPDIGNQARAEVDHPPIDSGRESVRVEHHRPPPVAVGRRVGQADRGRPLTAGSASTPHTEGKRPRWIGKGTPARQPEPHGGTPCTSLQTAFARQLGIRMPLTEYRRIEGEEQVPRWEASPLGLEGGGYLWDSLQVVSGNGGSVRTRLRARKAGDSSPTGVTVTPVGVSTD